MNEFSKHFVFLEVQQITDTLYVSEIAEMTDAYIFMLLYLECKQRYSCRKRIWYCNTNENGTHSSSEIQENRNGRKN